VLDRDGASRANDDEYRSQVSIAGAAYERHRRLIAMSLLLHFRPLRKLARGEKGVERCLALRP
jgi:hypothetical protein